MSDRISDARAALHAVLSGPDLPAARCHLYPQTGESPTPCAWVGYPEIVAADRAKQLTLPVVLAFDGSKRVQQQAIDAETARLWDALDRLELGEGQARARVQRSTIQTLGPDGTTTLAVVLDVVVDVEVPTFCGRPVADPT